MLHHRPVQHRHHRLRHLVGDRPQARARARPPAPSPSSHRLLEASRSPRPAAGRRRAARPARAKPGRPASPPRAAARRASPRRSRAADGGGALGGDRGGGQLEAAALARVLVAVFEEDRAETARRPPAQPQISLWSASGSSAKKAGSLAFSLTCGLPAARDRRGQVGAVDDRHRAARAGAAISAARARSASACSLEEGRGGVDLGVDAGRDPGQRRDLGGDHEHVGDRGARLEDAGQADHRHRRPRGRRRPAAPPVLATRRRAPSASAAAKQASVSSVLPE